MSVVISGMTLINKDQCICNTFDGTTYEYNYEAIVLSLTVRNCTLPWIYSHYHVVYILLWIQPLNKMLYYSLVRQIINCVSSVLHIVASLKPCVLFASLPQSDTNNTISAAPGWSFLSDLGSSFGPTLFEYKAGNKQTNTTQTPWYTDRRVLVWHVQCHSAPFLQVLESEPLLLDAVLADAE